MPDRVLDAPVVDAYSTTSIDKFANSMSLLPLPYTAKEGEQQEEELLYA